MIAHMLLVVLAALSPQAEAAPATVTVCVKGTTDLVDADSSYGDDLWTSNAAKKMRGLRVEVKDANDVHGSIVASGYLDGDGCMDADLEEGDPHWLRIHSRLEIGGRSLWVTSNTSSTLHSVMSGSSFTPYGGNTYTYTLDGSAAGLEWVNVAAAAGFTLTRSLASWPDLSQRYEIALVANPNSSSAPTSYDPSDGIVYLDPNSSNDHIFRKYIIAHELGHHVLHFAYWDDQTIPSGMHLFAFNIDYDLAVDGDCPGGSGHFYNSKEYQGAAIIEGHANFFSAGAFNFHGNNLDCRVVPAGLVEWDPTFGVLSPDAFSCEGAEDNDAGGVEYTNFGVDARDYMGDYCLGTTWGNRGVEHDWLRFFWDVLNDTSASMTLADTFDILVFSNPAAWRATDVGTNTYPMHAVRDAFDDQVGLGFEDAWDDWANTNGVER